MIKVIWNGDAAAVVYKPSGLATQAPLPHESLETQLRAQFANVAHRSEYLALPHRLDRPVSGLILVAFTKRAARLLGEQFEARRVVKRYLALVQGNVLHDQATWVDRLRKIDGEPRVELVTEKLEVDDREIKRAEVQMQVLARLDGMTLLSLKPLTGRMHQLRVQCAARGHAILGDALYGSQRSHDDLHEGEIALQSAGLEFNDPTSGKRVLVEAPLPTWAPAPYVNQNGGSAASSP